MFRAIFCPYSGAQDRFLTAYGIVSCCGRQGFGERQRGTTCTVWRKVVCQENVELILEINKTVIVASSWFFYITSPTLMMHGQTQVKYRRMFGSMSPLCSLRMQHALETGSKILRNEVKTCLHAHGVNWSGQANPRTTLNELPDSVSHPVIYLVRSSAVAKLLR